MVNNYSTNDNKIKNASLYFLGAMAALYLASFAAAHSQNTKVQRLAVIGMGSSALLGLGAAVLSDSLDPDDDPRMKDVYDEIKRARHNTRSSYETDLDEADDDMELGELENAPKSQFSRNHLNHGSTER